MIITRFLKKTIGSRNDRLLKRYRKTLLQINALEPGFMALSDAALKAKTAEFKARWAAGASLESLLPEAFAAVREASKRTLGMRHFDVQLLGGMALHDGKIAEMRTGEGKTLVATLPLYLNALTGKGVHLITVNDYLAKRDALWNQPIYDFLGLSLGVVVHGLTVAERQAAYGADISYGTNNEFGFDYLRDNMVFSPEERVQRDLHFAVVDEVDSILIDEARTPLIISGMDQDSSQLYEHINHIIPRLKRQIEKDGPGDYSVDEKSRQAFLTEEGHEKIEALLVKEGLLKAGESLYDVQHISIMHHIYAGLKAHALFKKDVDYIVRDDQVIIVDEHTGRIMPGRRWSDGIHQAVEAKEGVKIENENQTLASITFQNYFRLYEKLSGMTGTADTEAYEFQQIYGLEVLVIPSNKPSQRQDFGDLIYATQSEKFEAIIQDILECVARKQPVLVGTISIEISEVLSKLLTSKGIAHAVLNAKQHEREAEIIADAGRPGAVTIATNMAGRGTDIVLGGKLALDADPAEKEAWKQRHQAVIEAGGLHIIGTERHESRRIDNQLRGRSGRQGDPGSTRFYLSLQDNLIRIFVSDNISGLLRKLGLKDGEVLTHPWVTRAVENAQRKVEGHNFDIRKQLLEFDDVANDQRRIIYQQRNELLEAADISPMVQAVLESVIEAVVTEYVPLGSFEEQWDVQGLMRTLERDYGLSLAIDAWLEQDASLDSDALHRRILNAFRQVLQSKESEMGVGPMRHLEKTVFLSATDLAWRGHLAEMEAMRQSIHLRGYAQKDPKQEYKREAFLLFTDMLETIKRESISTLMRVQIKSQSDVETIEQQWREHEPKNLQYTHAELPAATSASASAQAANTDVATPNAEAQSSPYTREGVKIGRNDECPCGSKRKYKQCHGRLV
ncbi:MAG: preprotein translocase subunit SecA [Gammaproteobacteria bacterium]|nr:preprotein translocase subunit SecA [Gammaproteobacteria bacterium]